MENLNLNLAPKVKSYFQEALGFSGDDWMIGVFKPDVEADWVITLCDPELKKEIANEGREYIVSGMPAFVYPVMDVKELINKQFIWGEDGIVLISKNIK